MSGKETGRYGWDSSTSTEPESSITSCDEESERTSCTLSSDENGKENEDNIMWNNDRIEDGPLLGMVRQQIQRGKTFWKKYMTELAIQHIS